MTATGIPSIYVASLSDYNAGHLHGCWIDIDADTTSDDVEDTIQRMLAKSRTPGAEEYAIHDADSFGGWHPEEYAPIETVIAVAHAMCEHDSEAVAAWIDYRGDHSAEELDAFEDAYVGCWHNEKAFVMDQLSETGWHDLSPEQVEDVAFWLDWNTITSDLFIDDYWSAQTSRGVHIFHVT